MILTRWANDQYSISFRCQISLIQVYIQKLLKCRQGRPMNKMHRPMRTSHIQVDSMCHLAIPTVVIWVAKN
jgi:hypothetical protein